MPTLKKIKYLCVIEIILTFRLDEVLYTQKNQKSPSLYTNSEHVRIFYFFTF